MIAVLAAAVLSLGQAHALAERWAARTEGRPVVVRCFKRHAGYGCLARSPWKPGWSVTELVLVARCGGRVRAWSALFDAAPAGCGRVL